MARRFERSNLRFATILVLFELVSVVFLWILNPVGASQEGTFALLLAGCLVSFAMISYVYRLDKRGEGINRGLFAAGCCLIVAFLFAAALLL